MRSLRIIGTIALSLLITSLLITSAIFPMSPALAADVPSGAQIFELQCAGCHVGGGNIVRRGKNLKLKTLEKNQVATLAAIEALVTAGKGNMSAYRDRLSTDEITAVSQYVLDQAQAGWKS